MTTQPSKTLETFDNPQTGRDFTIRIDMPEFTCLCPKTGQPDFATLHLELSYNVRVLAKKRNFTTKVDTKHQC